MKDFSYSVAEFFYDESFIDYKEIVDLTFTSKSVRIATFVARTDWHNVDMEILRNMHAIDAEEELAAILAHSIDEEIKREMLTTFDLVSQPGFSRGVSATFPDFVS